ncbi:extracellular solute-binding protein [Paenibacillus alkaliterrae]|uniref:ABC transporter substrate-binding protein n=1 Tax=Paenibacillus alkaliterrae TaxID=320909 RepID=UPI001F2A301A|nr:extracellular solute-binding protein [Paenibacillus alkaliterrae]MCF2938002.1 extracellular solute-binding protein [Paenibacillus alkaliterrae]
MTKRSKFLKAWSLVLLIGMLSLAGCGSNNANNPEPTTKPTDSPQTTDNANEGAVKLTGDFEIQYFVGGYGDAWWKQVISEFQQLHPELKIKESAGAKINEQMKPRWIQGSPPDFVYIDGAGSNTRQMVTDDQLMDITDWLKEAENADGKKILDLLIAQPEEYQSGKFHAVPLVFGSWGTFYDKALFKEKGWEAPTDFESFLALGDKIKAEDEMSVYIHTGVYPYYINGALLDPAIVAMNNYDTSIIKRINSLEEGVWKSEPVVKALNQIVEMSEKGFIDKGSPALNHTDSQSQWLQHKAAFIPTGIWVESEMANDIPDGFEFGFLPSIGQDNGGKFVANPYISTVAIAKKAKNPEAAKAFLQYIYTEKNGKAWAELSKAPSNIKADLEGTNAPALTKEAAKYYNSPNTVVSPEVVIPEELVTARNNATVALTKGEITPEQWGDRLEEATAKIRAKEQK